MLERRDLLGEAADSTLRGSRASAPSLCKNSWTELNPFALAVCLSIPVGRYPFLFLQIQKLNQYKIKSVTTLELIQTTGNGYLHANTAITKPATFGTNPVL